MPAWPQHPPEALNNISMNLVLLFIAWCGQLGIRLDTALVLVYFTSLHRKREHTRTKPHNNNSHLYAQCGLGNSVKPFCKARMNHTLGVLLWERMPTIHFTQKYSFFVKPQYVQLLLTFTDLFYSFKCPFLFFLLRAFGNAFTKKSI